MVSLNCKVYLKLNYLMKKSKLTATNILNNKENKVAIIWNDQNFMSFKVDDKDNGVVYYKNKKYTFKEFLKK